MYTLYSGNMKIYLMIFLSANSHKFNMRHFGRIQPKFGLFPADFEWNLHHWSAGSRDWHSGKFRRGKLYAV